jgi:hypothetical protein
MASSRSDPFACLPPEKRKKHFDVWARHFEMCEHLLQQLLVQRLSHTPPPESAAATAAGRKKAAAASSSYRLLLLLLLRRRRRLRVLYYPLQSTARG